MVSIGVTANMASITPAPKPQRNLLLGVRVPSGRIIWVLKVSNPPNLKENQWIN